MSVQNVARIGYALFVGGLVVAVLSAAKLPDVSDDESTVNDGSALSGFPDTWPLCLVGLAISVAGVGLIRRQTGRDSQPSIATAGSPPIGTPPIASPTARLHAIVERMAGIASETTEYDSAGFRDRVDAILRESVIPISVDQKRLTSRLGIAMGAEVLVAAAVGERMLNRSWSASGDGDAHEAEASFHEAQEAFRQASTLVAEFDHGQRS